MDNDQLIQSCLASLFNFLKLNKICQISFAGYHNFVQCTHAEENPMLSKQGSSKANLSLVIKLNVNNTICSLQHIKGAKGSFYIQNNYFGQR